eukprot:g8679.t1
MYNQRISWSRETEPRVTVSQHVHPRDSLLTDEDSETPWTAPPSPGPSILSLKPRSLRRPPPTLFQPQSENCPSLSLCPPIGPSPLKLQRSLSSPNLGPRALPRHNSSENHDNSPGTPSMFSVKTPKMLTRQGSKLAIRTADRLDRIEASPLGITRSISPILSPAQRPKHSRASAPVPHHVAPVVTTEDGTGR